MPSKASKVSLLNKVVSFNKVTAFLVAAVVAAVGIYLIYSSLAVAGQTIIVNGQKHVMPNASGKVEHGLDSPSDFGLVPPKATAAEKKYYIAMRWRYALWNKGKPKKGPEEIDWYLQTHPRILVTNPKNGKQVIAAALDWGPAPYFGDAVVPQAVLDEIKAKDGQNLNYRWAVNQDAKPGSH